jgi:hypothetical protein
MAEDTKQETGAAAEAEFVAYRNRNTQTIHLYDEANPDLDARSNFERVELSAVPAATLEEARRERANQAAIANATTARQNRIRAGKDGEPEAHEFGTAGVTAATPVTRRTGAGSPDGVLSRPGIDDVQIGPDPHLHPKTDAELAAQVALEAEVPGNAGVLVKQHVEGDPVADEVVPEAHKVAERLAPGTEVGSVEIVEPEKPKTSRRKAGVKATATVTPATGTTAANTTGSGGTNAGTGAADPSTPTGGDDAGKGGDDTKGDDKTGGKPAKS